MMGALPRSGVGGSHRGSTRRGNRVPNTLEEIAKLSGVSKSTVSRVLNNQPRVSVTTRERVWEVIESEGYRPNLTARGLASGDRKSVV